MKSSSRKGVLKVATTVQKWGNSLGVRIPQNIAKEVGIYNGSQITEENRHQEIDFGKPEGKEIW